MAGYTSLAAICVMACMTMFHAQALIPEDAEAPGAWTLMPEDAGALGAWAPANSPSAALSGDASASTVASGTIPRAYQTGVRTPNTPKVPPITWTGLANAAEYKAQVHAAAGALNLVPINSLGTVDVSRAREMTFVNLGTKTIWAGVSGNNGGPLFGGGGWVLAPSQYIKFKLPTPFAGCRIWGRVSCKDAPTDPACATYNCTSASGPVPTGCTLGPTKGKVTLFEIHLGKTGTALDYYDISLVDAYNLPINIIPIPGSYAGASTNPNRTNSCGAIAFASSLNKNCPPALRELKDGAGATTECRNQCGLPATRSIALCQTCTGSGSCVTNANSLAFKNSCPGAYSFSYDDATSTYVCRGADYQIQFGVLGEKAFYIPL